MDTSCHHRPGEVAGRTGGTRPLRAGIVGGLFAVVVLATSAAAGDGSSVNALADLMSRPQPGAGLLAVALLGAMVLGAFHALEPGHGKTVVAAYLVGSRGTVRHALVLGLVVTVAHTAGVYLLGGVTFYASEHVVPERLYPWLSLGSGLTIAGLGAALFVRRLTGAAAGHSHGPGDHHHHGGLSQPHEPMQAPGHAHDAAPGRADAHVHAHPTAHAHAAAHSDAHAADHAHAHAAADHGHAATPAHDHTHGPDGSHADAHAPVYDGGHAHGHALEPVSLRALVALGISGGVIPCPAALVVLLSALSMHRVGLGLVLIVAFSVGLAAVLVVIGVLMVYAGRLMTRVREDGPWITRWLPLASSALMTLIGLGIAAQAVAAWIPR